MMQFNQIIFIYLLLCGEST
uniref:Uncharacterized protein n=1 Tax=Lepeophtheirus salmonis TaxID=72036 RepID=A0A0K2T3X6_LEPSM